ncbi:hypothetical protein WJX84_000422, partial [Apatococcus fuscideae]
MEETPPITTGNAVGDSEIDSDEDVILSSASDTGDDESTIRTDDDYAYANDAAAEEDYSETQQNTDTEAASSDTDEERFREMHDQHAAEEKRLLELYHQQQAARRSQGSPDLSADANEALTTLSSLVNDNATPDASLLQGLTPSNARDRIEEMLRGSSNVQATGRTLQEEVAAIGASLLPRIQESDLNQSSHSESHFSETRQSGQPDGRSSSVHHSSQHGTQSGADGNDQQSPRQLVGLDSIFDRAAHGSSAGGAKPGGSRMPFLPPRPSRGPKPSQPKPAQPAEGASQDRAQVPSDEPEVSQPTHQQPSASTAQPSAAAQRQPSAPAAQSALVRDPQRAQNNVHPGNGNTQARPAAQPDPDEPENIQRMRRDVNELRVTLYRLARRLNSTPNSNIVQQVIYRLDLSERIKAPFRAGAQRSSYAVAAQDMAAEADSQNVPLTFEVSIMMLGMSGVGKSALINRLLGQNVAPESAFGEHNGNKIREYTGEFKGVGVKIIDTPGLESSSNATAHNLSVLKK